MIKNLILILLTSASLFADQKIIQDQTDDLHRFRVMDQDAHFSGSGQFSEKGLDALLSKIGQKNVIIVDLRREPHGFLNGIPVSWIDDNNTNECPDEIEIQENEKALLKVALKTKDIILNKVIKDGAERSFQPKEVTVDNYTTERNLAAKEGVGYVRIPVTDHMRPCDAEVDAFISFYKSIPPDSWVHIHCKGGSGRTTTFFLMIDMIKNAKNATFNEIMDRQNALNGTSIDVPKTPLAKKYITEFNERLAFLHQFYLYAKENDDNFTTTWSAWSAKHPLTAENTHPS